VSAPWVVDAAPARDQLRDLAGWGFPAGWVATRLGMARNGVVAIRSGNRPMIRPYTALAISRLHAQYQNADPCDHGISRQAASNAQGLPLSRGWVA
jgi:hypothetical protein